MRCIQRCYLSRNVVMILLFLLASLNLYTVLTQRALEQTANLSGWMMSPIYRGGPYFNNITGCDGIWSCSEMVCERSNWYNNRNSTHITYMLVNDVPGGSCSPV